jgi:predicted nucleic acid-binding protein
MLEKQNNQKIIIADTSCLILLSKIEELELLKKLYQNIIVTPEIVAEYGEKLPSWFTVENVVNKQKQAELEQKVDRGEASAIALSLENQNSTVILDDVKARKLAEKLNIDFTGTLGIIIKAKLKNIIPSIKPILKKIEQTDFRISEELIQIALRKVGE